VAQAVAHERATASDQSFAARAFGPAVAVCTAAVATFLSLRLTAWPPHEDETLALFVGRDSLDGVLGTVLNQRGGAPLHFIFAWAVAHLGGGLAALRAVSALFAVASVPLIAVLCSRLVGRSAALVATVLAAASWMLLFHGVYGRMYSLFLCTSLLSFLVLLEAADRGGRLRWAAWIVATLLCIATHPYGALVLASQCVYVAVTKTRLREAAVSLAIILVLGIPFWRTDLVLAGRFEVGVGGGGERTFGDFTVGYRLAVAVIVALAVVGAVHLSRARPRSAVLVGAVILTPVALLMIARFGSAAAPESRHLVFVLPFFLALVATGLLAVTPSLRRPRTPVIVAAVAGLVALQLAWGWSRTEELYRGEPAERVAAREAAASWLAETSRGSDVLFGYDPLFLQAWREGGDLSRSVVPRADSRLALRALLAAEPLGRGVWVFDASDTGNRIRRLLVPNRPPAPREAFETRAFGPFLVVRTVEPTGDARSYLKLARRAQLAGKALAIADADVNLLTILEASGRLATQERERADSRSTVSR
jgi:4-amino-4-deoxy-L-arabinose transferase-like glycosyltransferase